MIISKVSMMADGAAAAPPPPPPPPPSPPPHIEEEEPALESDLRPAYGPSDAALYSPSTTVLHSEVSMIDILGGNLGPRPRRPRPRPRPRPRHTSRRRSLRWSRTCGPRTVLPTPRSTPPPPPSCTARCR
ncbi:hypothetical protein R5R35_008584 [Gryllus longicercus]|uniref:Uncharacterized protein n=1 Tax=Gryllus longicercus TaxID=2509291 RepID=A0AAN9VGE4_9ORTH